MYMKVSILAAFYTLFYKVNIHINIRFVGGCPAKRVFAMFNFTCGIKAAMKGLFLLLIITETFAMVQIWSTSYGFPAICFYISSRKKHSSPLGHWEGGLGWVGWAGWLGWAGLG